MYGGGPISHVSVIVSWPASARWSRIRRHQATWVSSSRRHRACAGSGTCADCAEPTRRWVWRVRRSAASSASPWSSSNVSETHAQCDRSAVRKRSGRRARYSPVTAAAYGNRLRWVSWRTSTPSASAASAATSRSGSMRSAGQKSRPVCELTSTGARSPARRRFSASWRWHVASSPSASYWCAMHASPDRSIARASRCRSPGSAGTNVSMPSYPDDATSSTIASMPPPSRPHHAAKNCRRMLGGVQTVAVPVMATV